MKKFLCVALAVVLLLCLGVFLWAWNQDRFDGLKHQFGSLIVAKYDDSKDYTPGARAFSPEEIRRLDINWISGSVTLLPSEEDRVILREPGGLEEELQLHWKLDNGTLTVQYCKSGLNALRIPNKDLEISAPKWLLAELESVEVETVSGEVFLSQLSVGSLEVETVSGNVVFTACTVDHLDICTVSGTVSYEGSAREVELQTSSGNCALSLAASPEHLEAEAVSANLTLVLPEDAGFTATVESVSGDFETDFLVTKENGKYQCGDGSGKLEMKSFSGNLVIEKQKK